MNSFLSVILSAAKNPEGCAHAATLLDSSLALLMRVGSVILNEVKDLKTKSTAREILRCAANELPSFVILNEVKDLTGKSNAREILRGAQDDERNLDGSFSRTHPTARRSPASRFLQPAYLTLVGILTVTTLTAQSQFPGMRWSGWANENDLGGSLVRTEGSGVIDEDFVRTAREVISHSTGTPNWSNPRAFEKDVFTFARAIFKVGPNLDPGYGYGKRLGWWVDFPDADLNLSYRLQQMTSMKVDPNGRVMKLNDPDLHNHPFIIMEHPGYMMLRDAEVEGLRKYLHAGGALVVIDFWNTREWEGFSAQMKRVLPDRTWTEITLDHPIFHCVFDIKGPMQRLQVPTMQFWNRAHNLDDPNSRLQIYDRGAGSHKMTVRTLNDDKGHIMVIAFHNSDITDGWEREGEHADYFQVFSEKVSYPLGINLLFYLMTH